MLGIMPPGTAGSASHAVRAFVSSQGLIEIKLTGCVLAEDAIYLPDLSQLIDAEAGRVSLLFDTIELESYSPSFSLAHIDFFKNYRARLNRIAVAHELKSIVFAISTVALASSTTIKGFATRAEALGWILG
jgi:hypothetical protein